VSLGSSAGQSGGASSDVFGAVNPTNTQTFARYTNSVAPGVDPNLSQGRDGLGVTLSSHLHTMSSVIAEEIERLKLELVKCNQIDKAVDEKIAEIRKAYPNAHIVVKRSEGVSEGVLGAAVA